MKTEKVLFIGGPHRGKQNIDAMVNSVHLPEPNSGSQVPKHYYFRRSVSVGDQLHSVMCHEKYSRLSMVEALFKEIESNAT